MDTLATSPINFTDIQMNRLTDAQTDTEYGKADM